MLMLLSHYNQLKALVWLIEYDRHHQRPTCLQCLSRDVDARVNPHKANLSGIPSFVTDMQLLSWMS